MDATFTEDQEMLAVTARKMAEALGPKSVQDLDTTDVAPGTADLLSTGMLGLSLPDAVGGSGATCVEVAIVAEAFGRGLFPVPFAGPVLALQLLAGAGAEDWVSAALGGRSRVTIGLDRHLTGPASGAEEVVAWDAAGAAAAAVLHPIGNGWQAGVVPVGDQPPIAGADLTRRLCRVPASEPARSAGRPLDADGLDRWQSFALSVLCADMVGAMEGALHMAVEHAKSRHQFGRPIGSFQAIQHLCAERLVDLEASRSATYFSAWAVGGLPVREARLAARRAKSYTSRAAQAVTEAVLQVHGGIGQTWESLAHVYLRRVLLDRFTLGDETVHVRHLAEGMAG